MTIRGLLQKEIWSKRTSRIVAPVVLLLCGIGLLWTYCATPSEKRLARAAITEADEINSPEGLTQEEFDVRYAGAKSAAANAGVAAITLRDRVVAFLVKGYVSDVEHRRIIWSLPDDKMGRVSLENDKVVDGREKKLRWLAEDLEMHEKERALLVSMVGNTR